MASMYDIKGFDVTPLDKDKVADFTARMETLQREQLREQKDLQVRHLIYIYDLCCRCYLAFFLADREQDKIGRVPQEGPRAV